MKRIVAILLLVIISMSLMSCSKNNTLIGSWKAPVSVLGFSTAYPEDMYVKLEFRADGTGTFTNVGLDFAQYPDDFTYMVDENAIKVTAENGDEVECIYEIKNDALIIIENERISEFTRIDE